MLQAWLYIFFCVDSFWMLPTTGTLGCILFLHDICVEWLQFAACHSHFGVLLTSQAVSAQAEDLLAAEALQRAARAAASSSPTTGEEESSNSMVSLWAGKNALVIAQGFMFLLWACLLCDILLRVTFDRSHKCKVFVKLQCSDLWIHLSPNKFEWKWTKILLPCHRRHSTKKLPEVRTPESPPPFASHMPQDSLAAKALASHVSEQVPWVMYSGVILGSAWILWELLRREYYALITHVHQQSWQASGSRSNTIWGVVWFVCHLGSCDNQEVALDPFSACLKQMKWICLQHFSRKLASASWSPSCFSKVLRGWNLQLHETS